VHLRRALLLFAIVLGMAALAAGLSRPAERSQEPTETAAPPATATSPAGGGTVDLRFSTSRPRTEVLPVGTAARIEVSAERAGMVEIREMGLSAAAEPHTPAAFYVLPHRDGRYPILFSAAGEPAADAAPAGTLVVEPAATEAGA
jgi:hypothetical protein